jgi:hypothetical protein
MVISSKKYNITNKLVNTFPIHVNLELLFSLVFSESSQVFKGMTNTYDVSSGVSEVEEVP